MKERVEELVAEFVQRREDGEALEPTDFVAAHPDCADELRTALAALGLVEATLPDRGAVPARVGDWEVEGELGRGGMSRVLAARRGEQRAAIKLLGSGVFASPRALERLRREGELLLRFAHPNVVRVLELGSTDGLPYLALERIDGANLAERIAAARADGACAAAALPGEGSAEARAARLVAALARAVHAAHGVGLLHRDIKPGNVLLRGDGTPVLIDFGLSADESAATLTQSGDLLGTPQFMAPEQARGERADARTDVYGLGVVLHELLTRTSRFPADDAAKALARVRREPLALGPELRGPLRTILARALAFARAHRFAGALDLAVQLERVASNAPISVRDLPLPVRIAGVAQRHRRFAATAIALLVVVGASLSWSRFGGDGGSRLVRLAALRAAIADAWLAEDAPALTTALDDLSALEPTHPLVRAIPAFANQAPVDESIAALVEGARALVREEPGQAIEPLERAAARFADEPLALVMLGIAAERAGRGPRAAEALSAAVHLLPHSSASRLALARVHRKAERHADAELLLVEASRIAPRAVEVWIALCDVRLRLKDS
ncbi:MAG: protein kinase, partial [Planctomycetes bacterium]|nr:protein kinase [Planctomycetota bacterium]